MKDAIAKLEIMGVRPDGEKIQITAIIGKPYPVEGNEELDEWACPVSLEPLYKKLHDAHGGGSFQALCLASNLILNLLQGFKENGGQLVHADGTQFPIDAYSFGFKENT